MARVEAVRRSFDLPLDIASSWQRLAQVQRWPEWAAHIHAVDLEPPGTLTAQSAGTFRLQGGPRSTFRVTEFQAPTHWLWVGPLLWLVVRYDHRFEAVASKRTLLTWVVELDGPGASAVRPAFARAYGRNLDRAIPRFQDWAVRTEEA